MFFKKAKKLPEVIELKTVSLVNAVDHRTAIWKDVISWNSNVDYKTIELHLKNGERVLIWLNPNNEYHFHSKIDHKKEV